MKQLTQLLKAAGYWRSYYDIDRYTYELSPCRAAWDAARVCWRIRKVAE